MSNSCHVNDSIHVNSIRSGKILVFTWLISKSNLQRYIYLNVLERKTKQGNWSITFAMEVWRMYPKVTGVLQQGD